MLKLCNARIAIIGMGYVGLPLAIAFSKKYPVIGFDINSQRIKDLKNSIDVTQEVSVEELKTADHLLFSDDEMDIKDCNVFIVTVPTPIDEFKRPNLHSLLNASAMIGRIIKHEDIVIYESTVYPGATEDDCIPVIEKVSGLKLNQEFFAGYSPERINPGDKKHRVEDIVKVTSGSNEVISAFVDSLYASVITAGTFNAGSIKVAEAAKVIENTQRDVNIALINELSIIFGKLGIDTEEVLKAAGTKWNFLPFRPGLVGGHCIGVDPYYLTHKSESIGYRPEMILAGRRINDGMAQYVVSQLIKKLIKRKISVSGSKVLILGLSFKENCPDIRNTKVVEIVRELLTYDIYVDVLDPRCSTTEAKLEYDLDIVKDADKGIYDAVVIAVGHSEFKEMGAEMIRSFCKPNGIVYDLKYVISKPYTDLRL